MTEYCAHGEQVFHQKDLDAAREMGCQKHHRNSLHDGGKMSCADSNAEIACLKEQVAKMRKAIEHALSELGIPDESYPAPVYNAVGLLRRALLAETKEKP